MPCYTTGSAEGDANLVAREASERATAAARAACDAIGVVELLHQLNKLSDDTLRWWEQHQAVDRERLKREALAKLTPAERRALGVATR